jgi:ATP-dependent RNA helicase DDX35
MSVKFWRPGTVAPGSALEREEEGNTINVQPFVNQFDGLELEEQRKRLPIYKYRRELLYLVENYRTTVIVGETGCGKTTQIPQYLHESGWTEGGRCVVCTQPRRLAAKIVAKRVAEEMKATLGSEVGYGVRFDNFFKPNFTRIKFVTDGVLIREMMLDPLLSGYSVIMVDEVHERGVYTDLLLGLVKQIMKQRSELRLLVASGHYFSCVC